MLRYSFPALAALALLFSGTGCQKKVEEAPRPKKDEPATALAVKKVKAYESHLSREEAEKRAEKLALTREELAKYAEANFRPKEIQNYFQGMDRVAGFRGEPLGANAWPQQLLDQATEQFGKPELVDPIPAPFKREKPDEPPTPEIVQLEKEVFGRNAWMIWCGGNEGFWDWLATDQFGFIDLLKLIDSRNRSRRFEDAGMINEPKMTQASTVRIDEFGLWLDRPAINDVKSWREGYMQEAFGESIERWRKAMAKKYPAAPEYAETAAKSSAPYGGKKDGAGYDYLTPMNKQAYKVGVPAPAIYGTSSGVVGLRLFPNPKFIEDPKAQERWDPVRFYNDPEYFNDPKLIRPYRVGMACAFCHASWHPLDPPRDRDNPEWTNISGSIGSQYLRIRAVFGNLLKPDSLIYHALDSQPPGTIDTSLIASDNINNTNTMNAVWGVPARVVRSFELPREKLSSASISQPSLWGNPDKNQTNDIWKQDTLIPAYEKFAKDFGFLEKLKESNDPVKGNPRYVPRVLLDGSDSVGAWVALARVYLNIGTHYEQWNTLHTPVIGFSKQKPFKIADSADNSVYWHATELRVAAMRDYFLKVTPPMPLLAAQDSTGAPPPTAFTTGPVKSPGIVIHPRIEPIDQMALRATAKDAKEVDFQRLLSRTKATHIDTRQLARGRQVFARNCIACHSSVQPESDWAKTLAVDSMPGSEELKAMVGKTQELEAKLKTFEAPWKDLTERESAFAKKQEADGADSGALLKEWDLLKKEDDALRAKDLPVRVLLAHAKVAKIRKENFLLWEDGDAEQKAKGEKTNELWDHNPGQWFANADYQLWAKTVVENPQFWTFNFLSSDFRIPVNVVRTNSARAMATNALTGNMWEDYSSDSFRNLPSVGPIDFYNPYPWKDGGKRRERLFGKSDAYPFTERSDGNQAYLPAHKVAPGVPARGGGPGFYRVPSLISVWATAPLLHNNSLGLFNNDPSVEGRLVAFDDAIRKLLWPEKRLESSSYNGATADSLKRDQGLIWRAPNEIYVTVPAKFAVALGDRLPLLMRAQEPVQYLFGWIIQNPCVKKYPWLPTGVLLAVAAVLLWLQRHKLVRWAGYVALALAMFLGLVIYYGEGKLGEVRIGPFPKGTPVNLLLNTNPDADPEKVKKVIKYVIGKLGEIKSKHLNEADTLVVFQQEIAPALMEISKCPDFVMDRGHYYPWFDSMTDEDKNALIELLKTF